jgi:hypothetical protein
MEIRNFKYQKIDGSVGEREVLVVREAIVKGKKYLEGIDLAAIRDAGLKDSIKAAAAGAYLDQDGIIKTPKEHEFEVKAALKYWRKFDKSKILS